VTSGHGSWSLGSPGDSTRSGSEGAVAPAGHRPSNAARSSAGVWTGSGEPATGRARCWRPLPAFEPWSPSGRRSARADRYTLGRCPRAGGGGASQPPSSSGLGSRPFKAETRVRIPLGVRSEHEVPWSSLAVLATLSRWRSRVRIPSGPRGAGRGWHRIPGRPRGEVAQSVEHAAENRGVGGSIPSLATRRACPGRVRPGRVSASRKPNRSGALRSPSLGSAGDRPAS
jgi:hypothetical protein